jgi:hypothetical protein
MTLINGPEGQSIEVPDDVTPEEMDAIVAQEFGDGSPIKTPSPRAVSPGNIEAAAPPSLSEASLEEAPQTAGSIAATALVAAKKLPIPGMAAVAGFGAMGGEAWKQIGQHILKSPMAPPSSIEAAKRIGEAGLWEGSFEFLGGYGMKAAQKFLSPFKKSVIEGSDEVIKAFDGVVKPVVFMPAEITENRVLDILHNVADASIIGGNSLAKFGSDRLNVFADYADNLIKQFGGQTAPDDLGNLFVTALEAKKKVHSKAANVLYNNVSNMIGNKEVMKTVTESVPSSLVDEAGNPIMKEVSRQVKSYESAVNVTTKSVKAFVAKSRSLIKELGSIEAKNAGDDLVSAIEGLPKTITFDAARELRSRLIARVDEFSVLNKKAPAIGKAKRLISLLDEAITKELRAYKPGGPDLTSAIKVGDQTFTGSIHADAYQKAVESGAVKPGSNIGKQNSGFVDGEGKWLSTEDAIKARSAPVSKGAWEIEMPSGDKVVVPDNFKVDENMVDNWGRQWTPEEATTLSAAEITPRAKRVQTQTPLEAWRSANEFYKRGQEKFNNTMLRRMIKMADETGTGGENIAPAVFRPGQVTKVRKAKRALGSESEEWRQMKGFFIQHLFQKSYDTNGDLVGKKLLNNMSGRANSFGYPMMSEVLTGPQLREIEHLGRALKLTQESQGEGAGRMLIQLSQAGAIGMLATGNFELPAATIVLGPAVLSRMLLNPTAVKLLTTGIKTPAGSKTAAGTMARLTAMAARIRNEMEGDK